MNYTIRVNIELTKKLHEVEWASTSCVILSKICDQLDCVAFSKSKMDHWTDKSIIYFYTVDIENMPEPSTLFNVIKDSLQRCLNLRSVTVVRSDWATHEKYKWHNGGTTYYRDGSTFTDLVWTFNVENGIYCVVDSERELSRKISALPFSEIKFLKDHKFTWTTVGSHNNPLTADNIEDAMLEFEAIYYNMLYESLEKLSAQVAETIGKYTEFHEYRQQENRVWKGKLL